MTEIEILRQVLRKTGDVVDGVRPDQAHLPTPCPDYDVEALTDHIAGWAQVFAAGCNGDPMPEDPGGYHGDGHAAADFRAAADRIVAGWSANGLDRSVPISSGEMPGELVFNMTMMEYLAHGWDLAVATGQPVPYTEAEAAETLERARRTLPPEYQGEGQAFGAVIPIAEDAPALDRLLGFLGRRADARP